MSCPRNIFSCVVMVVLMLGSVASGWAVEGGDICAEAGEITENGSFAFDTTGASSDDPCVAINQDIPTLWYRFTAPANGWVHADLCGSNYNTYLTAWQGDCPTSCEDGFVTDNGNACAQQSAIEFAAEEGETYLLAVSGMFDGLFGPGVLNFEFVMDAGDSCDSPIEIVAAGAHHEIFENNTSFASADYPCLDDFRTVWYRFIAPDDGQVIANLCASGYDPWLSVFRGADCPSCPNPDYVTSHGFFCDESDGPVSFQVVGGETYLLAVTGHQLEDHGPSVLDFNYISNQPASECVAATPLGAGYFPDIEFDTTGASGDDPCAPGIPTVWYKHYRDGGRIKGYLSTEGSSFDTHITVYETDGDCPVTCDDVVAANNRAYDGFGSRVWVEMKSGKTYYFAIRGATAEDFGQGRVVFRTAILNQVDACDRRPDVVGVTGVFMYTKESPFFRHCSGEFSSTQWMRYRARVPGTVTLRACDSSFPVYVSVFEGEGCDTSCDNVVTHGAIDCAEDEMISFRVEPDIWYMIAVGGVESGDYWKPDDSIGRVYATLLPDAGDDCSDLGGIQSGIRNISLPFDTAGASSNSPCAGENHPTVWYSYDPFRQGLLILTVSDADFTPFGEVYETAQCPSDCDTLVASGVVGSDLSSALTALSPDFSTGRFRIAIRGASPGEAGQGVLNLRFFEGEQAGNFTNNNDGILKVADVTQFAELLAAGIEVPDFMGDINDDQVVDWADVQALAEMIVE